MKPRIVSSSNIAFGLVFAMATLWLLGIDGANYLRKIDLLSIFIFTKEYFADCAAYPGGALVWCATFLTQTFYHPWLGALIYTALLLCIAWLALKAFGLRRTLFPAMLLIPGAVLLALLSYGYLIFSIKSPGFAFNLPLGIAISLLAFWGYRCLDNWIARLIAIVLFPICGYCLMGFYGLLITGMCAAFEIAIVVKNPNRRMVPGFIAAAIGACAIIFVPKLWFAIIGGDLPMSLEYRYPLPFFYENEDDMWRPYIFMFALMVAGCFVPAFTTANKDKGEPKWMPALAWIIGLVSIAGIFQFRYQDRNFSLTLDMCNAIEHGDWEDAMRIIHANQDIEPTRVNVVLTDIALLRLGMAPNQLFKTRVGSAPYNTTRDLRATHDIVAMPLAYHTGLANYAYRWAVEYEVEYGRSVERLQYMVKSALLNKDYELARKSLDNLSKTTFHKKWAEKYYPYLDNPELIKNDAELASIQPLICSADKFLDDNNQLEGYVWKALASIEKGSFQAMELSLVGSLICFRPDLFADAIPLYAQNVRELPVHFQEGVLMWSLINNNDFYKPFKIDKTVMQRFELFKNMLSQTSSLPEEMRKARMQQMFGDTYWYYCMFAGGMQVI